MGLRDCGVIKSYTSRMCKSQSTMSTPTVKVETEVTKFDMFNMSFHGESVAFTVATIVFLCVLVAVGVLIYKKCMVVDPQERLAIR